MTIGLKTQSLFQAFEPLGQVIAQSNSRLDVQRAFDCKCLDSATKEAPLKAHLFDNISRSFQRRLVGDMITSPNLSKPKANAPKHLWDATREILENLLLAIREVFNNRTPNDIKSAVQTLQVALDQNQIV